MKFLFLALFLGVAHATLYTDINDYDIRRGLHTVDGIKIDLLNRRDVRIPVNKDLVRIQVDILKLLDNINHLCTDRIVLDISKTYRLEDHVDRFVDKKVVLDLIRLYKTEGFLNRDKVFNVFDDVHRYEVIKITKVLIGARDLGEFFKVACWLRNRVNGGVFTYALLVAVRNRDDCVGVVLPPMYEILPMKFFKNKVIQKALQIKMQGQIFDEKYAEKLGVERIGKDVYLLKTDYTGVNINNHGDDRLTYFTEDIGLNNNFFMSHITYPFWLDYNTIKTTRHDDYRRGEWFIFTRLQLLARYYMERLSVGLGEIPKFKWDLPIRTGYNPSLRHHNGLEYSIRPNNYVVNTVDNLWELKIVKDFERRIRDAIDRGYIWTDDGKIISLRHVEDIDKLGNLLQCNAASVNNRFIHGVYHALRLLGNRRVIDDDTGVTPSVLESFDTMIRDPIYFQLLKRIIQNVYIFTDKLRPYTFDELNVNGIRVNDVKVDKLVTYFDTFDVDITNVVNRDIKEMTMNKDDIIIKTRQVRLNHLPFHVNVDITSDDTTDVIVKLFLGPKLDALNRKIHLNDNRINFMLLDKHIVTLKKGLNTITRESRLFNLCTDDVFTTRKLINKIENCFKGVEECFTREVKHSVLIPDRLILPRGTNGGMLFQLFVTVTPVRVVRDNTRFIDTLRYPLDRKIMRVKEFLSVDNFFLRDVVIYHKDGIVNKHIDNVDNDLLVSRSSESFETIDRKNILGRRIDSIENVYDRNIDSREVLGNRNVLGNIWNKRMDSIETLGDRRKLWNVLDDSVEINDKRRLVDILGKRVDVLDDVSRLGVSLENRFDNSKEFLLNRFLKNKLIKDRRLWNSDENISGVDSNELKRKLWMRKLNNVVSNKYY